MEFNEFNLDPRLLQNLRAMGFEQPTPIQSATIAQALEGRDILGSAETGTGKTAAFLLPLLQRLIQAPGTGQPRALILLPTRELALQVAEQATELSRGLKVRIAVVYGGVKSRPQEDALHRGVDVVIATPGRLLDHAGRHHVAFAALQVLVIDEADRMMDIGFLPDLRRIVRLLPRDRQTMLFSATLGSIVDLSYEMTREPVRVEVEKTITPDLISQALYSVPEHLKFKLLERLLEDESLDSVLVFTRTKQRADRLVDELDRAHIPAAVIHGDLNQGQRVAALEAFRHGQTRLLVATDIAARGIDVEGISHVINYDVPNQPMDYVHRVGRTGRAHTVGQAYTLVTPIDYPMIQRIERILKRKIERRVLDGLDYSTPAAHMPTPEEIRLYVEANRRKPEPVGSRN
jgi:ATP-dependent RNA helicase RhlE